MKMLLITTGYPPQKGGGVIRPSRLVKYLPHWGWSPFVLTRSSSQKTLQEDESNIYRAPGFDLPEIFHKYITKIKNLLKGKVRPSITCDTYSKKCTSIPKEKTDVGMTVTRRPLADYLFVPDTRISWIPGAFLLGLKVIFSQKINLIYSTSPDPSAHLVGYLLCKFARKRWIVEFRDPWIENPFRRTRPFKVLELIDKIMEKIVIRNAHHIIVTSEQYKRMFLDNYSFLQETDISFIPNGVDLEDFKDIAPKRFDKFTILHAGKFYEERSSIPFLRGFNEFINENMEIKSQVQAIFIGGLDNNGRCLVQRLGLSDVIIEKPMLPHSQAIEYMCGADLLLLVPGPGDGTMPGKTYEYLAAKKPIIALVDEGPAHDLVQKSKTGLVVSSSDIEKIKESIAIIYQDITHEKFIYPDVNEILCKFDRKNIARQVANVLNNFV